MIFTGVNYRSIPTSNSFTLDLNKIIIYYSGDKHNPSAVSGFHFGFSGTSNDISFRGVSGKIYDPEGRVVYGYSDQTDFSFSVSFDSGNYEYYFNNALYCSKGVKTNFNANKFFLNCNGLTVDASFNIYSPEINYSLDFPDLFSGSLLTGVFTNLSSYDIKIFTGNLTNSSSGFLSTSLINNINVSANTSENIVLSCLTTETGVGAYPNLSLETNFGTIQSNFEVLKL